MRLQDIMTEQVRTIPGTASAEEAWELMRTWSVRHLAVTDPRGRLTGIVSERDLGGRRGAAQRSGRGVAELMAPEPVTASPETTVRDAANLLRGHTIGCLPIVRGKELVGIVTITDLLDLVGRGGFAAPGSTGKTRWKPVRRMARTPRVAARR